MPAGLPRGASGARWTKGRQAFDVQLRGFKLGIIALHKIQLDVANHFNKDLKKMAEKILKNSRENLKRKVYEPAGVDPSAGGTHQTKGYHLTGNLYRSGRYEEISNEKAKRETSLVSPNLGD